MAATSRGQNDGGVRLTVIGSGDAFGSGGRFNTCFLLEHAGQQVLVDCGATSMVGLKRLGHAPDAVSSILCTHLHGDHIGGLPFFFKDPVSTRRAAPLVVAGPVGLRERASALTEGFFPGSWDEGDPLPLRWVEYPSGERTTLDGLHVTAIPVVHSARTNPHGLRIEMGGRVVAYSGDTEWTDAVLELAEGADLFLCDGFGLEPSGGHLDVETLSAERARLGCERLLLTHPGDDVLAALGHVPFEYAFDGMVVELS